VTDPNGPSHDPAGTTVPPVPPHDQADAPEATRGRDDGDAAPTPHERAAAARLLEQVAATLDDDRVGPDRLAYLCGFVAHAARRGSEALRRGHRADQLEALTIDLGRRTEAIAAGGRVT
jgi:hypothetical protein